MTSRAGRGDASSWGGASGRRTGNMCRHREQRTVAVSSLMRSTSSLKLVRHSGHRTIISEALAFMSSH